MTAIPTFEVRKATVQELAFAPNLQAMLDAYAEEAKNKDLPPHKPNLPLYEQMEKVGLLHVFAAYSDRHLVGFLMLLVTVMPHYSTLMASTESFFVDGDFRKGGTAKKLLEAAETFAKGEGIDAFFVSAPVNGRLAQALPMLGPYRETNRVFFRSLA